MRITTVKLGHSKGTDKSFGCSNSHVLAGRADAPDFKVGKTSSLMTALSCGCNSSSTSCSALNPDPHSVSDPGFVANMQHSCSLVLLFLLSLSCHAGFGRQISKDFLEHPFFQGPNENKKIKNHHQQILFFYQNKKLRVG